MSVKVKSAGGGVGGLDIKNSTTASYISYDSDIEPGYFVELVEKQSDKSEVKKTNYNITPTQVFEEIEGQYGCDKPKILNCVQYSNNQFLIAVF